MLIFKAKYDFALLTLIGKMNTVNVLLKLLLSSMDFTKIIFRKKAGVVVLYDRSNDSLVLTQRSIKLRHHPGEICFPGGRQQKTDSDLYATALRELEEELGISPSRVNLEKPMKPERTLTGFIIQPWFASIESLMPYHADSSEVSEVFYLPMQDVKKAANYKELFVNRYGISIKTYQFTASSHFVWGATARIMMQLIEK